MKFQRTKNVTISGFFLIWYMKYEKKFIVLCIIIIIIIIIIVVVGYLIYK